MSRTTLAIRAALAAVVGVALVLPGAATTSAVAAVAGPVLTAFPANESVRLSWSKVGGATSYTVDVSRTAKFDDPTRVRTMTARSATVDGLRNGPTYYARVRSNDSQYSRIVTFVPTSRTAVTQAKVTAAGTDKIKVSWTAMHWGTRAYVIASSSNEALDTGSSTRWTVKVPISSTSAVLAIPASYRHRVGSKTGNPVFVRVVTYNDTKRYRSKVAFGFPTPPAVKATSTSIVSVASANIQGVRASANFPGLTWMDRRKKATAAIARTKASVVAVQEASTAVVKGTTRHYQDVENLLEPHGYRLAYADSVVGTAGTGKMKGAQLYYRPADVKVLASGLKSTKRVAARYSPKVRWLNAAGGAETDRYFAWALMQSKKSGVKFYVVSLHLQVGEAARNVAVRTAAADGIHRYMLAKAKAAHLSAAPLIVAGDWNTDVEKHPGGPTTRFVAFGYQDAAASASTTNRKYSSANDQNAKADYGYPKKPVPYSFVGTRIDHIMVRGGDGSKSYDNVLVRRSDGTFDPRYHGSDHNIQLARISLL